MTAALLPMLIYQPTTVNYSGQIVPVPGGKLYCYAAGTTTPQAVYSDVAGITPLSNPVILDANGIAQIYLGPNAYKFLLTDAAGVTIFPYPIDNVQPDAAANLLRADLANTADIALGDALIGVKQPFTNTVARTQHQKNADFKSVKDWGATGDGVTDDTAAIQAALNYSATFNVGIWFPVGTYSITNTLNFQTGTCIVGESMIETIIQMKSLPGGAKPTFTGSTTYTPTLSYFPIMWNASNVQWFSIRNIMFDGNNLDVYGLRLQENFYGDVEDVVIMNCNKYAYINVRGQSIYHKHLILFHNQQGMLTLDNTAMTFATCGFEQTGGQYLVEMRTPVSTKCGTVFRDCWFEDSTGLYQTTGAVLALSGRNVSVENGFFNMTGTPAALKAIGAADARTFDGISSANATGLLNGKINLNRAPGLGGDTSFDPGYTWVAGSYSS